MPAMQPITRTVIAHDPGQSRWFPAKFAGVCSWSGLRVNPGERVCMYAGAIASARGMSTLGFGSHDGGYHSTWERTPAVRREILARVAEGDRLVLCDENATIRGFTLSGGKFHGGVRGSLARTSKSAAQLGVLLDGAVAFMIEREGETFMEQLIRERATQG